MQQLCDASRRVWSSFGVDERLFAMHVLGGLDLSACLPWDVDRAIVRFAADRGVDLRSFRFLPNQDGRREYLCLRDFFLERSVNWYRVPGSQTIGANHPCLVLPTGFDPTGWVVRGH